MNEEYRIWVNGKYKGTIRAIDTNDAVMVYAKRSGIDVQFIRAQAVVSESESEY